MDRQTKLYVGWCGMNMRGDGTCFAGKSSTPGLSTRRHECGESNDRRRIRAKGYCTKVRERHTKTGTTGAKEDLRGWKVMHVP